MLKNYERKNRNRGKQCHRRVFQTLKRNFLNIYISELKINYQINLLQHRNGLKNLANVQANREAPVN